MQLKNIFVLLFFLSTQAIFSQDLDISFLSIPDSLKQNANAIVRFYDTQIKLESHKKMSIKVKKVITILNQKGDKNSKIAVYYDKSNHIKKFKIQVYDQFGIKIKDIKSKEIKDYSAADGFSLFNDNRLKYYKHIPTSYPYTISYIYEKESSNTAFIPRWLPLSSYNQSIQHCSYHFSYPTNLKIHKIEKNIKTYTIKKEELKTSISYQADGIKAINYEDYSPNFIKLVPTVKLASNRFRLEGVDGEANNWKEFGKWMYTNLISGRTSIPEETKLKIRNLVKDVHDPIEKAKIIYNYVQNKTRYISIQVGIGGWMPMLASDVDKLSYGDCKALTNYTKTLMDVAGVESYYTAVYAGRQKRDLENDVISVQGNHVFLYLPSKEKDFWLECTSQTVPFGYQGTFTDDRDVLIIKPEGGEIKHTGIHKDKNSFQKTRANYQIMADGSIAAKIEIQSGGIQYKNHYTLEKKPQREIDKHYKDDYWFYINNLSIENFKFTNNKDSIVFKENISIKASDYASFSGNRLLFVTNPFNRSSYVPKRYRERKFPLEISRGFIDTDEFEMTLPDGYTIEAIPENVLIKNKFGKYEFSIKKVDNNQLIYSRTYFIKKGMYSKSDYKNYRNFIKKVVKFDKTKIVLIKK